MSPGSGEWRGQMLLPSSFLVTHEAGVCQGTKPAFVRFPWAGHCARHFPIFLCNYSRLTPSRFLSFCVCLLFLLSYMATQQQAPRHRVLSLWSFWVQQAPPRASQWILISPTCSEGQSLAVSSPPVPQFPPHLWEVNNLCSTKHCKFSTRRGF